MVPVAPDATAPADDAVHSLCDPDRKSLKSAREPAYVHRFDEEMDVIALHRKLEDPKAPT